MPSISSLTSSVQHRWVQSLMQMGVDKVKYFNPCGEDGSGTVFDLVQKIEAPKIPFSNECCLVTYTGFEPLPLRLLFRRLEKKDFHLVDVQNSKLNFYVSEKFDINFNKFRYGYPIVLLEGVLDVESFSYLTGYPYCIGYLTSTVSEILATFLSTLSDKILIIPDNDGEEKRSLNDRQLSITKRNFAKSGVVPEIHKTKVHDFGDMLSSPDMRDIEELRKKLKNMVKGRSNVGCKIS